MFPSLKSQMAIAAGGCVLLCSLLMGQVNTATILGSVTDASGAVIPGATISVLNVGTQAALSATSDTSGAYILERLPVGEYTLSVKAQGFKQFERQQIKLDATNRVKIDVAMEVGGVTESVTVSGGASLVATQSTELVLWWEKARCATFP